MRGSAMIRVAAAQATSVWLDAFLPLRRAATAQVRIFDGARHE
jgi:hypothetical protein